MIGQPLERQADAFLIRSRFTMAIIESICIVPGKKTVLTKMGKVHVEDRKESYSAVLFAAMLGNLLAPSALAVL
jgi:hypothetical protein